MWAAKAASYFAQSVQTKNGQTGKLAWAPGFIGEGLISDYLHLSTRVVDTLA